MKIPEWLKFWKDEDPYFKLDPKKEYTNEELIEILRTKPVSLGAGNFILLRLVTEHEKKIKELEKVINI